MLVCSISDAEKALGGAWENKKMPTFKEAERLLAAAREGESKPEVAFHAFIKAAQEQDMLQSAERTWPLKLYDELVRSSF
ncbi:hypothetical protein MesoLj131a_29860 [Mesorhizobium sp. 131-2-1]|nr:hypothetical protein MesoLj131a_29860 [Mesorhizobium sp. 131-2-1]